MDMEPYQLPDAKVLERALELQVLDADSNKVAFKSLAFADSDRPQRRLVVFIRHFFCGNCEDYVRALSKDLPPSTLSTTSPPTTLLVIGCGQPSVVSDYKSRTSCPFDIYCDPDRKLYAQLGMVANLELGPNKPEYVKTSMVGGFIGSAKNILGSGSKGMSGGSYSQNGGEWLWDEQGELKWCHRMRYTRDHAEVAELKEVLRMKK